MFSLHFFQAILLIQLLADSGSQAMALTVTYIHGESCDPRVQSELIPFEQQHDKFWFCDRQQKLAFNQIFGSLPSHH
jgi:hypothetical protein